MPGGGIPFSGARLNGDFAVVKWLMSVHGDLALVVRT